MPITRPSGDELLEAVSEFLKQISKTELSGLAAFHARVAANAVTIARRENDQQGHMDEEERQSLLSLLGLTDHAQSLESLNTQLASEISSQAHTLNREKTLAHLRHVVRNKLKLSNPKYICEEEQ